MKIALITGSRAEWGLLQRLAHLMHDSKSVDLQLVVTGSHLSHEFGYTKDAIDLPINEEIECVLSSDTSVGISKAFGLAVISFGEAYQRLKPDAVLVLGDRWEILACAVAAHIARIPVIHIGGGEVTEGAYDDAWRHSITKMSQLHFVYTDIYRNRIIQLGENPDSVFNVGSLGCDINLNSMFTRSMFAKKFVIVFHSVTNESDLGCYQAQALYDVLVDIMEPKSTYAELMDFQIIAPGCDRGSRKIRDIFSQRFEVCDSMPQYEYFSHLKISDAIIGNSSSGIVEAPALGVPTINIGDRQQGRLMADSIIQAEPTRKSIKAAFDKLYSKEFQDLMKSDYKIYYKGGNVAEKILKIIKEKMPLEIKKGFYDIQIPN